MTPIIGDISFGIWDLGFGISNFVMRTLSFPALDFSMQQLQNPKSQIPNRQIIYDQ
jgi:hypothetical protein